MKKPDSTSITDLKDLARGRELELLERIAGISRDILDGKHHSCPKCGGKDRFRLIDENAGAVYCNRCFHEKNGDFLAAIAWYCECTISETVHLVARYLGATPTGKASSKASTKIKSAPSRRKNISTKERRTYATAGNAIAVLTRRMGSPSGRWDYLDAEGSHVGSVTRWEHESGKEIRPVSLIDGRWGIGAMPEPRPLFGLSAILAAGPDGWVIVVEGEKAADATASLGFAAATSSGGAKAWSKTDWSPLAHRRVVIWPDADESGQEYADNVARHLLAMPEPAAEVRVLDVPNMPEKGDAADFVDGGRGRDELLSLIDNTQALAQPTTSPDKKPRIEPYAPFPVAALPEPVRGFVVNGAAAIGCDPAYIALPLLAAVASAIGNTRHLRLKRGWDAPPILWTAVVGESGTAKTPAFKLALKPVRSRQDQKLAEYAEAMSFHEADQLAYEKELAAWKRRSNADGPPPEKPKEPIAVRYLVGDTTVEALAPLLLENQRGLLLSRDELSGWIGSFDRYASGGGGADSASWLSMYSNESIVVDRKTGSPKTIHVPAAAVSVTGGVQPGILERILTEEHRESGLAARLLMAYPPRRVKAWTEADIDPADEGAMAALFDRLYDLEPNMDDNGAPGPGIVALSPDAKMAWIHYYNAHGVDQADASGDLAAAFAKLEEGAARLALVVHFVRWATGDASLTDSDLLDEASMTSGVALALWFKREARRIYAMLNEAGEGRAKLQLAEWIDRKGGVTTTREVQQGHRQLKSAEAAKAALDGLVSDGLGRWEPPPSGQRGRPTNRFVLSKASEPSTSTKRPPVGDTEANCVDGRRVDGPSPQTVASATTEWRA